MDRLTGTISVSVVLIWWTTGGNKDCDRGSLVHERSCFQQVNDFSCLKMAMKALTSRARSSSNSSSSITNKSRGKKAASLTNGTSLCCDSLVSVDGLIGHCDSGSSLVERISQRGSDTHD